MVSEREGIWILLISHFRGPEWRWTGAPIADTWFWTLTRSANPVPKVLCYSLEWKRLNGSKDLTLGFPLPCLTWGYWFSSLWYLWADILNLGNISDKICSTQRYLGEKKILFCSTCPVTGPSWENSMSRKYKYFGMTNALCKRQILKS